MTLALLLTAVTGAWADEPKVYDSGDVELFSLQVGDILMPGVTLKNSDVNNIAGVNIISNRYSIDGVISPYGGNAISSIPFSIGENGLLTAKLAGNGPYNCMPITEDGKAGNAWVVTDVFATEPNYKTILIGGTTDPNTITVEWNATTKTGTFEMPAFDVEIAPIYAPTAVFATDGNLVLAPTAVEGIYAESTDAIVKAGTVAKIGETENVQGTLMYAVTSTNQAIAPALTAFSADVPTAKDITVASDVLVWYYIKGADTPQGQEATAENTFNDSEICATPIPVTILSNKFDINFNAANDNTIEAGKATVTVGGTAATVTEGKLEGVKMGSEVKMTAKQGYKFRKVEVKKSAAPRPLAEAVAADLGKIVGADGKIYATKAAAEAVATGNAVAMIAYVGTASDCAHGLAIALADESGTKDFGAAGTACSGKAAVTGGTWRLPSIKDWQYMFIGCGASGSYSDNPSSMSYSGLASKLTTAQGDALQPGYYWSSTEYFPGTDAWDVSFDGSSNASFGPENESIDSPRVRACLAF